MSQRRRLRRNVQRVGNVLRLPVVRRDTEGKHREIERWLLQAIAALAESPQVQASQFDVLQALCRVTAFSSVAQGAPDGDVLQAMKVFMEREREALGLDKEPPTDAG